MISFHSDIDITVYSSIINDFVTSLSTADFLCAESGSVFARTGMKMKHVRGKAHGTCTSVRLVSHYTNSIILCNEQAHDLCVSVHQYPANFSYKLFLFFNFNCSSWYGQILVPCLKSQQYTFFDCEIILSAN